MNYTLAGVRQRRRLPHPDGVRRGRRAAPDDHLRERPRRGRLPQRAGVQRARRVGLRRREGADHRPTRTGSSRCSTWSRPTTTSPRATRSRRSTTRSRRSTWRSACSTAATCRSSSAAWPRTCSGPSATKLQRIAADDGRGAGGSAEPRRAALGHLLLQLLAVPVDSRQLGDQAALPGDADPPAEREAGQPRRARRHHLRLGRQARSVRRPPRREEDAAAALGQRRRRTTSASSWSAPTRRSSATCTTCSATPTPCTSASTRTAARASTR